MKKNWQFWTLAVIITLLAAYYQRRTGPTYPQKVKITLNNKEYKLNLLRTTNDTVDTWLNLKIPDTSVTARIFYHRYKIDEPNHIDTFKRDGEKLAVILPHQPMAGKLEYYLELKSGGRIYEIAKEKPVVIRFKASVPGYILILHILFMFTAFLFSNLAGLMAAFKFDRYRFYTKMTFWTLIIGGGILGPIMQKYAFGDYWTGIPFGFDLTDNKTLIAFIFWLVAFIGNLKKERPYLVVLASVVMLIVTSIPHSMRGSQYNYNTGQVGTGK
jgi:hypothetical protein